VSPDGGVLAAVETSGFDPDRGELAVSVLRGTRTPVPCRVEVSRGRGEKLPVSIAGRRLTIRGFSPGQEYRWRLVWPGGTSLPAFVVVGAK
jgi:hypothetical protein